MLPVMIEIDLVAILPPGAAVPSDMATAATLHEYLGDEAKISGMRWPLVIHRGEVTVTIQPGPAPELYETQLARTVLDDEQKAAVDQATDAMVFTIAFPDEMIAMTGMRLGLVLIRPLLKGYLAIFDPGSFSALPGHWLESVAHAPVPPRPESLFSIHAVRADEDGRLWLHTHGLRRLGLPELEALDGGPDDSYALGHLINAIATRLLVHGLPTLHEAHWWGHGIALALVPWPEVAHFAGSAGGGADDRDENHAEDNLVLCLPGDDGWRNGAEIAGTLGPNPVFYRSNWETERMETLARARWELYVQLHKVLAEHPDFLFTAKLAYGDDDAREHLWFEVHSVDRGSMVAKLLNEPYGDLGMHEGDIASHPVDRLTDLAIHSKYGTFDPERMPQLAAWVGSQMATE